MNVLVIGSGGREHAICKSISHSNLLSKLYCSPGNPGISSIAECVTIDVNNNVDVLDFCKTSNIDMVIVGPEIPLANGMVDYLEKGGVKAFGPNSSAAELESSKIFMKEICKKYELPTARYVEFSDPDSAFKYVSISDYPIVIKADGLAAGKGVTIAHNVDDANNAITDCLIDHKFGNSGNKIVIEEFLEGKEASYFVITDGHTILPLGFAQDYKPIFDGNEGPNTGGMGSYTPVSFISDNLTNEIFSLTKRLVDSMKAEGRIYKGILYMGMILTSDGPKILECNVRFGDPECQVLLPRLKTDFLNIADLVCDGRLDTLSEIIFNDGYSFCLVLAAKGYPENPIKGSEIIIEDSEHILHAGTIIQDSKLLSNGGRVLNIVTTEDSLNSARSKAYKLINNIKWQDMYYRNDIGLIENE